MNCAEYQEIVAAHVDGVLLPDEREGVESHLAACPKCRHMYAWERQFRHFIASREKIHEPSPDLQRRLRTALAREQEKSGWQRWLPARAVPLFAGGLALAVVIFLWGRVVSQGDLVDGVARAYEVVTAPNFSLDFLTSEPKNLEEYFKLPGRLDFPYRVLDFRPQGFRLLGGSVMEKKGRVMAVAVWKGKGTHIVCHQFRAENMAFPAGGKKVDEHHLYVARGLTMCLSREGNVACCLTSRLSPEAFLQQIMKRI